MVGSDAPLTEVLLCVLARYLRWHQTGLKKARILRFCRRVLMPRLQSMRAIVSVSSAPEVRLHCFALGGSQRSILSEWLFFTGCWQPALSALLRRSLRTGDTFIDVGAHEGYFSLLAASLVGESGAVVAIEACGATCQRVSTNLLLNPSLASRVRTVQCAAADGDGTVSLFEHKSQTLYNTTVAGAGEGGVGARPSVWEVLQGSGALNPTALAAASRLQQQDAWSSTKVRRSSLESLLTSEECARARLVKVDVEGGEWAVLQGMGRLLVHGRNELEVVVEVTPRWLALSGASVQGLFDFMRGFGYNAYVLAQDSYEISGAFPVVEPPLPRRVHRWEDTGSSKQADVIFSRRDVSILS